MSDVCFFIEMAQQLLDGLPCKFTVAFSSTYRSRSVEVDV